MELHFDLNTAFIGIMSLVFGGGFKVLFAKLDMLYTDNIKMHEWHKTIADKLEKVSLLEADIKKIVILERDRDAAFRRIDELRTEMRSELSEQRKLISHLQKYHESN